MAIRIHMCRVFEHLLLKKTVACLLYALKLSRKWQNLTKMRKKYFFEELGITSSGLDKLIAASYSLLGLISYLTAGETETRAWTITKGTKGTKRQQERYTVILKEDLSRQKLCIMKILLQCGSYNAAKRKRSCENGRKRICCKRWRCYIISI